MPRSMKPTFGPGEHHEIARVQVRVEEAVAVDHADDRATAPRSTSCSRSSSGSACVQENPGAAFEKLHHEHASRPLQSRKIFGKTTSGSSAKFAAKVSAVVGFAPEIHLAERVVAELLDDPLRLVAREEQLQRRAHAAQELASRSGSADPRLHHLDHDDVAVDGRGAVDLRDATPSRAAPRSTSANIAAIGRPRSVSTIAQNIETARPAAGRAGCAARP